jgi:hypothetical protein
MYISTIWLKYISWKCISQRPGETHMIVWSLVVYDKYYRGQHKLFYVTGYSIVPFYFVDMYVFMSHGIVCLTDIVPFYFVDMYVFMSHGIVCLTDIVPFYFVDMYVFMSHGIVCLTDIVPFCRYVCLPRAVFLVFAVFSQYNCVRICSLH